jgi:hypothetical protein
LRELSHRTAGLPSGRRRLLRHRLPRCTEPDAHAHAYAHRHADADPDADAHRHADADPDAYAHRHRDPDPESERNGRWERHRWRD